MAAKKQQQTLTPQQAHYVIQRLLAARALSASDVAQYLAQIKGEMRSLKERITTLRLAANGSSAPRARREAARPQVRRRKKAAVAKTATNASQKLQGSYIGYVRQFGKAARGQYNTIA